MKNSDPPPTWIDLFKKIANVILVVLGVGSTLIAYQQKPFWAYLFAAITLGVILWIAFPWLVRSLRAADQKKYLKWFFNRGEATPEMTLAMKSHTNLVFLGISQTTLSTYLQDALANNTPSLDWERITVFFANNSTGRSWEQEMFLPNLRRSRQDIAATLCRCDKTTLPHFQELIFKQCRFPLAYGGSLFSNSPTHTSPHDTLFAVYYLPSSQSDTKKSLTLRITRNGQPLTKKNISEHLLNTYINATNELDQQSISLGSFSPSLWDWSVSEWDEFTCAYPGMQKSMTDLINMADLGTHDKVIDLGAGTGVLSRLVLDKIPQGCLTLLEASPVMLNACQKALGEDRRLEFALHRLLDPTSSDIDIRDRKYDAIFCHMSLNAIVHNSEDLHGFARWCSDRLNNGGKVILNAHNGALRMSRPKGYETWKDPLRMRMSEIITRQGEANQLRRAETPIFDEGQVKEAFEHVDLYLTAREEVTMGISIPDRIQMWSAPAILDSFINVKAIGLDGARKIAAQLNDISLQGFDTLPRTVVSWRFERKQ
jgi:ubiquinone/menaquinone biosynthesis C-methylase UbiE